MFNLRDIIKLEGQTYDIMYNDGKIIHLIPVIVTGDILTVQGDIENLILEIDDPRLLDAVLFKPFTPVQEVITN